MTKRLVLVAGNIASGKTSLTERLGSRLGWRTAFESVLDKVREREPRPGDESD